MLDDRARGERELAQQQASRGEIEQVDQRQLFPVQLLDTREQVDARPLFCVIGAALVRVLAIPEVSHLVESGDERLRECLYVAEPARDRGLVCRGCGEGLGGEGTPRRDREIAALA